MTDLVLINSPIQRYSESYRPDYRTTAPLGLGYLGTMTRNTGISTTLIDAEAKKLSIDEIVRKANALTPKSVGINMSSTNYHISLEILDKIEAPHKMVGGAHSSLCGAELSQIRPDLLVVRGEAESMIADAVKYQLTGLVNAGQIKDLDSLPFIDRSLFVGIDPTLESKRCESTLVSSRGCPYLCDFCTVPITNGRNVRTRSIDNVISEVKALQSKGVESVHFMDDILNYNRERTLKLSRSLGETGIEWRGLARVELLDDELLKTMADSGCYRLAFGLESATPRLLKSIGKNANLDLVRKVFAQCKQLGIETKAFFTFGHPTETEDEIRKTIDFAEEIKPNDAYFMVVRAFPKTKLYAQMKRSGFTDSELNEFQQFQDNDAYVKYHVMNVRSLNGMSNEQLDNLVREAYGRFYKKPVLMVD
jgi:anaerobic magnesium-protoporphyrin IX monomethyl ester cyclase